jgi:hypothetical protein
MRRIALYVLFNELASYGASWEDTKIAVESTPFGEVVCYVEGCGGGDGVFVVDEGYGFDGGVFVCSWARLYYDVPAEEVGVAEYQLDEIC